MIFMCKSCAWTMHVLPAVVLHHLMWHMRELKHANTIHSQREEKKTRNLSRDCCPTLSTLLQLFPLPEAIVWALSPSAWSGFCMQRRLLCWPQCLSNCWKDLLIAARLLRKIRWMQESYQFCAKSANWSVAQTNSASQAPQTGQLWR